MRRKLAGSGDGEDERSVSWTTYSGLEPKLESRSTRGMFSADGALAMVGRLLVPESTSLA
jgi:hypothetical protein